MAFYVDNGVVLFAALLLVGYLIARQRGDLLGVAGAL